MEERDKIPKIAENKVFIDRYGKTIYFSIDNIFWVKSNSY
jgi:hypothetical protein